jgi:AcrR family transcriptional regulator
VQVTITKKRDQGVGLRERKRAQLMRRVQQVAVRRFAADGFAGVTVEEIAAEADVAPITIYRHFGTKERLVLWDEFDPPILDEIARRLPDHAPLGAVRGALSGLLDAVYAREAPMALARATLIQREPALQAAAALDSRGFVAAIADLLVRQGRSAFDATVLAEAAVAALSAAVGEWQRLGGEVPLAELIGQAFDVLERGDSR